MKVHRFASSLTRVWPAGWFSLSAVVALVSLAAGASGQGDARPPRPLESTRRLELAPVERVFLAKLIAGGQERAPLVFVTRPGRADGVAQRLLTLGEVLSVDAEFDIIRAVVPIERIQEVISWTDLDAAQIEMGDERMAGDMPDVDEQPAPPPQPPLHEGALKSGPPPTPYTPQDNPYTGEAATEALQFKRTHPTYDGRGVVIGGVEWVNPRTPSLAWAMSSQGGRIPKFADYVMPPPIVVTAAAIPAEEHKTRYDWQRTEHVHPDRDGRVVFNQRTYALLPGIERDELRMTLFRTPGDRVPAEVIILWAMDSSRAWACERQQTNVADCLSMELPRGADHSAAIARLGDDEERTVRVAVDRRSRAVGLQLAWAEHGTMCASVATGHSFLNSGAEGVAPGAQFLPVTSAEETTSYDDSLHRTSSGIEAVTRLFRNPHVNVVTHSGGIGAWSAGGRKRWLDNRLVSWQFLDRLLTKYPKLLFTAAGNGGPYTDINEGLQSNTDAITVGAYTPAETWWANFGLSPSAKHTLAPYSQYGPSEDGALKPDLLGLSGTLCATAMSEDTLGSPYYQSPRGYGVSGGTSASTPHAAGHAALLISAAEQAGIPHDPKRMKVALFSTARFLDGVEARVQGRGLIQVARAWEALRRLKDYEPPTFETRAPVRTFYSPRFVTPNVGRGLYERDGWAPGQRGDRDVTITRTSGPSAPATYVLRWHGDTTTFTSSRTRIVLPLNRPVNVPVHIAVGRSGAYSAILDFVDPDVDLVVHSVLCTVIVAEPLTAANGYTATITSTAPRPGSGLVFVNVPPGTTAMRVQVTQKNGKHVELMATMPDGHRPRVGEARTHVSGGAATEPWRLGPSRRETYDQTFARPMPGVWQLWMTHDGGIAPRQYDADETRPARACEFTVRVTALSVEAEVEAEASGDRRGATVTFVSSFSPVDEAKVLPLGLGGMRVEEPVVSAGFAPVFFDVDLPAGTTKFEAEVSVPMTPASTTSSRRVVANLSLVVFRLNDDSENPANAVAYDISPGDRKHVEIRTPNPGRYKVCLDGWRGVPVGGLRVHYRDGIYHPLYGTVSVQDRAATLSAGERRRVNVFWDVRTTPAQGRFLVAQVGLFSDRCVNMQSNYLELWTAAFKEGRPVPEPTVTLEPAPIVTETLPLSDIRPQVRR